MRWIANLIGRPDGREKTEELPCLVRLVQEGVRMDLLEYQLPCGHPGYRVELEFFVEELGKWVEIASLRDFNLEASIDLLKQAHEIIARWQA